MGKRSWQRSIFLFILVLCLFIFSFNDHALSEDDEHVVSPLVNARSIAINPETDTVVVVIEKDDDDHGPETGSAAVVDLNTQTVIAKIPVGKEPTDVAIDRALNLALIGNKHDRTISVIDLGVPMVIGTIPLGKEPESIAINQLTHKALVAVHDHDKVMIIDLMAHKVAGTAAVGKEAIDVAVEPQLNLGLILHEKDHNVSVLDLNTYKLVRKVPVGKNPRAIDINPERHIAAVVNEKDNTLTIVDLVTWQTTTILVGKPSANVTVNSLDNRALVICGEDRSLLLIDLDMKKIVKSYPLNKKPRGVAVNNFSNIAAVIDEKTDGLTLIQLPNPAPEVTTISPNSALRGSNEISLSVEGKKFIKSSIVYFGDIPLTTTFIDNHHVQATIPEGLLSKAGNFPITISNPAPKGGTSGSVPFTINNPMPSITALDPSEVMAGTPGVAVNILGSGFFEDTKVYFGGIRKPATFINNTKLQIDLTAEDLKTPEEYEIMTYNLLPGGGNSNSVTFIIKTSLEIGITSPLEGDTIDKAGVMVKGTFRSGNQDVGITVNGVVANVKNGEWVANGVPLIAGANAITAVIKDASGNTASASTTINTTDTAQQVRLSANITSGILPLTTFFSVSTEMPNPTASYQIDFEGNGVASYSGETFENISHTYTTEGIFYPTLTVTDDQGNIYSDTIAITILSKTEIDTLLKGKWEGMKGALAKGDVNGAVINFDSASQGIYRDQFTALSPSLADIVNELSAAQINMVSVENGIAEYEILVVREGTVFSLHLKFVKDGNGRWKIWSF